MATSTPVSSQASIRLMFTQGEEEVFKSVSLGTLVPAANSSTSLTLGAAIAEHLTGTFVGVRFTDVNILTPSV